MALPHAKPLRRSAALVPFTPRGITVTTVEPSRPRLIVEFDCRNCRYRVVRTEQGWVHAVTRHPSCGGGKIAEPVGVRDM